MSDDLPPALQPRTMGDAERISDRLKGADPALAHIDGYKKGLAKAADLWRENQRLREDVEASAHIPEDDDLATWNKSALLSYLHDLREAARATLRGGRDDTGPIQTMPPKMSRQERDNEARRLRGGRD